MGLSQKSCYRLKVRYKVILPHTIEKAVEKGTGAVDDFWRLTR